MPPDTSDFHTGPAPMRRLARAQPQDTESGDSGFNEAWLHIRCPGRRAGDVAQLLDGFLVLPLDMGEG